MRVKPGQTLFDLARESGLSVEEIREVNGLGPHEEPAAGDHLFLPAGRAQHAGKATAPPVEPERSERAHESSSVLSWPADGVVLRSYAPPKARGGAYDGILIAAPAGTAVHAARDGTVAFAGDQGTAYGAFIVVEHDADLVTVYAHLDVIKARVGARVRRGDVIGTVGTTGNQEAPRLHFQVRRGRTPVDPEPLLPE